jgi:hypothetical protein
MNIIGHSKIISFFDKLIANKTLSQSYCFVGRDKVGKRTIARYLSAKMLKIDENKLDTYPDFYYLTRQVDEKTNKLKKEISIAQSRQIKERLGNKSWFGNYQVVIIDEAELLNEESGNALLKMLEEGGEKRVFFLLTEDDSKLLPTIRSRCQMVFFSLVNDSEIENRLVALGYDKKMAKESADLAWGKPGRAIDLCADSDLKNSFSFELTRWEKIISSPFYKKVKEIEDLFKEGAPEVIAKSGVNTRSAEKIFETIETWSVIWRNVILDKLAKKENPITAKSNLSLVQMVGLVDTFKKSQVLLAQNINPKLVVEQILLSI